MKVRNHTGITQVVMGQALPANRWLSVPSDLPLPVAMEALRLRTVEVSHADSGGAGLLWMSALSLADGYGTAAENFLLHLKDKIDPLYVRDCWFRLDEGLDPWTLKQLRAPITDLPERGLCMATPGEFRQLPTQVRMGFTMYESDEPLKLHPEWAHDCRQVDELLVPSQYSKDVFAQFYDGPIHVCDLVVHPAFHTARERKPKETFTFVSYGTLTGRKAPYETLKAFQQAFPMSEYPNVRMVFKTRGQIFGASRGLLPTLEDQRIKIIDDTWDRPTLLNWLHEADCMLFTTKGEGYGMPPREALCTGMPVVYAHNTGMVDLQDYAWAVETAREEDSPLGGVWRIPNWDHMIEQMRNIYHNREMAYALAQESALRYIRDKGNPTDRLLSLIQGAKPRVTTAGGITSDHDEFFALLRERVPNGTILCVGPEGAAELQAMGYRVFILDADPFQLYSGAVPKADAIVCIGVTQRFSHQELRRHFRQWLQVAPIFFAAPTPFIQRWPETEAYLRQRGEWSEILQDFHAPLHYYSDKTWLMGEIRGMAVRADGLVMSNYQAGTWHPRTVEA